jgi:hypothetical protein
MGTVVYDPVHVQIQIVCAGDLQASGRRDRAARPAREAHTEYWDLVICHDLADARVALTASSRGLGWETILSYNLRTSWPADEADRQ